MENSSFKLKEMFTPELIADYANRLKRIWALFDDSQFIQEVFNDQWESLELKQRMRRISTCMHKNLPHEYLDSLAIVVASSLELIQELGEKMRFEYSFVADFVEQFGLDHYDASIDGMEIITRLTSCEFAVRLFLKKYPENMYQQMVQWASHPNSLVRRLACEGFRPRLPWGMGIPALKKDPSPMIPILIQLKNDPAETVRRSVANHLNDISKDHSKLAIQLANQWHGENSKTNWIVRHACRGLLKAGVPEVMHLFGFEPQLGKIVLFDFKCDHQVQIGDALKFSFSLQNKRRKNFKTRLEYVVDFITSTGKISKKVFYIKEFDLTSGTVQGIKKQHRFQDLTTRKHFEGKHKLYIKVNGVEIVSKKFMLISTKD